MTPEFSDLKYYFHLGGSREPKRSVNLLLTGLVAGSGFPCGEPESPSLGKKGQAQASP